MALDIRDFIDRLRRADTADEKFEVFARELESLGITRVLYGFSSMAPENSVAEEAAIFTNFAADYVQTYEREGHADHDVSVRHCMVSDLPTRWFDSRSEVLMTREERTVEDTARDFGFTAGITIPARQGDEGLFGGISLATTDLPPSEFETLIKRHLGSFHLMALFLHNDIQRVLNPPPDPVLLSDREKECILWAAMGLSSKEIARRVGITFRTVEHHLENARQKLGANNRVHAVAKAISAGLIRL